MSLSSTRFTSPSTRVGLQLAAQPRVDHDLTLVIPAFNEARRLPPTLAIVKDMLRSWGLDYRVMVADDGSTDDTARLAAHHGRHFRCIRLPHRGKGAAVREGMLQATGAVAAFTDADLPFDLKALRHGYELVRHGTADLACGARDLNESVSRVSRSVWRQCSSWMFRAIVRRLLSLPVVDTQCGLKVFLRRAADAIFSRQQVDGMAFDVEVVYLANRLGLLCAKIPVTQLNEYASTISITRHAPAMISELFQICWHEWIGAYESDWLLRPANTPPSSPRSPSQPSMLVPRAA